MQSYAAAVAAALAPALFAQALPLLMLVVLPGSRLSLQSSAAKC
jgi:hypothetical protein